MSKQQVNNKKLQAQDTTVMLEKYIEDELIDPKWINVKKMISMHLSMNRCV